MNDSLKTRIQTRLTAYEKAFREIEQLTNEAKNQGDMEKYIALISPTNTALLYTLLGENQKAQNSYTFYSSYYSTVRDYEKRSGVSPMPISRTEAVSHLFVGNYDQAKAILMALSEDQNREQATKYGILLIESGAKEEGERLLRERIEILNKSTSNLKYHPLAECYFWLGLQEDALDASHRAVDQEESVPIHAFHAFLKTHTNTSDSVLKEDAEKKLNEAIEYFYDNDFLDQAVDVFYYQSMLTSPSMQKVIQGMTSYW